MRILGQIPHPELIITVFKSGNKYILKFETGPFEQSYKFLESEIITGFEAIRLLVNDQLVHEIYRVFDLMNEKYKLMNS